MSSWPTPSILHMYVEETVGQGSPSEAIRRCLYLDCSEPCGLSIRGIVGSCKQGHVSPWLITCHVGMYSALANTNLCWKKYYRVSGDPSTEKHIHRYSSRDMGLSCFRRSVTIDEPLRHLADVLKKLDHSDPKITTWATSKHP